MKKSERRQYERLQAKEGAFAVERKPSNILGQVIDISEGGLSFLYIDNGLAPEKTSKIGIYFSGEKFYFDEVNVENISDSPMLNKSPFTPFCLRRRSVKFGAISDDQALGLEKFISNHTRT
ncbi:MAG: PilZ domain-containing protein [Desulfobacterales bacterium]|nr:PilZ domain-containing protein [Desulfobacterales bacterium]